jgi:hypothetical protein
VRGSTGSLQLNLGQDGAKNLARKVVNRGFKSLTGSIALHLQGCLCLFELPLSRFVSFGDRTVPRAIKLFLLLLPRLEDSSPRRSFSTRVRGR